MCDNQKPLICHGFFSSTRLPVADRRQKPVSGTFPKTPNRSIASKSIHNQLI